MMMKMKAMMIVTMNPTMTAARTTAMKALSMLKRSQHAKRRRRSFLKRGDAHRPKVSHSFTPCHTLQAGLQLAARRSHKRRGERRSARSRRSAARRTKAAASMWPHTSLSISILQLRSTSHLMNAAMMKNQDAALLLLLLLQSHVALSHPSQNLNASQRKNGAQPHASQSHPSSNVSRKNIRNAALQTVEAPTPTASSRCKCFNIPFISSL